MSADAATILTEARDLLGERVDSTTMELWLRPITVVGIANEHLMCEAPAELFVWIARRYAKPLGDAVRSVSDLDGVILRRAV